MTIGKADETVESDTALLCDTETGISFEFEKARYIACAMAFHIFI